MDYYELEELILLLQLQCIDEWLEQLGYYEDLRG
jgi:hypothetical protein